MNIQVTGLGALLILVADIYAIIMVLQSSAGGIHKLLWVVVILLFPLIGFIIWYLAGPRGKTF